jgi:dihydroneopterin aldolase
MRASTEITLRAMRFHALVGILPHERTTPQPIEIDLIVTVGDGEAVVDYRRLYDERVAAAAFAASERITRTRVAVRKPHVALGGPLAYAEVTVEQLRPAAGV